MHNIWYLRPYIKFPNRQTSVADVPPTGAGAYGRLFGRRSVSRPGRLSVLLGDELPE
jgi:hypothetical protein